MPYVAVVISLCALGFTAFSFWWVNARRGTIEVAAPGSYAFGSDDATGVRLRFPLALYNNGARALIVADLRLVVGDGSEPLGWQTTRSKLQPASDDEHRFATPIAVPGRSTRDFVAEFGDDRDWRPEPLRRQRLTLEARVHPSSDWTSLETFDWWPPPDDSDTVKYLTYRNDPTGR